MKNIHLYISIYLIFFLCLTIHLYIYLAFVTLPSSLLIYKILIFKKKSYIYLIYLSIYLFIYLPIQDEDDHEAGQEDLLPLLPRDIQRRGNVTYPISHLQFVP